MFLTCPCQQLSFILGALDISGLEDLSFPCRLSLLHKHLVLN